MLLFPEGTIFATNKLFKYGNFLLQDKVIYLAITEQSFDAVRVIPFIMA
jgi:1-acyl-sn-glycerol-3-phosphate acyltransferase